MWDKIKFISCLSHILCPIFLFAQTEAPSELKLGHEKVQNFIANQEYDSAQIYLDKLFSYTQNQHSWSKKEEANLLSLQAEVFKAEKKYALAELSIQNALSIRQELYGDADSLVAKTYHQLGVMLKEKGDVQQALQNLEKALSIQENVLPQNSSDLSSTYNSLMYIENAMGKYQEALTYGQKALTINRALSGESSLNVAINLHNLGNVYRSMGAYFQSLNFLKQALAIKVLNVDSLDIQLGDTYYSLANTYMEMGNYQQASMLLLKARNIYQKNNHSKVLKSNVFLGIIYGEKGDYERAIAYNQMVLDHQLTYTGPNHPMVAGILNNIAICQLESKQYQASLVSSQKALDIQKNVFGDTHISHAYTFDMIGKAYLGLGDTIQAESYFIKALQTAEKLLDTGNPEIGGFHNSLGKFYLSTNNRPKARFHYGKGKHLYQSAGIGNHPDIAQTDQQLARMHLREGYISKAFEQLQASINLLDLKLDVDALPRSLPSISHIYSKPVLLELLGLLGEIWYGSYLKSKREKDLNKSERAFKLAVDVVDSIRLSYQGKNSKLILSEKAQHIYRPALQTSRVQYERYGKKESLERIFLLMEKSKSAWLNEAMQDMAVKSYADISPEILEKETELKTSLNYTIEQLFEAETQNQPEAVEQWRQKRFMIQQQLDSLLTALEKEYPQYHKLKYNPQPPSFGDIQSSLDAHSLLIDYYIGGRTLFIFCMTANDQQLIIQKLPPDYISHIQRFRTSLNNLTYIRQYPQEADSIYVNEAYQWYQLAIAPALAWANDEINHLILIPYGQMGFIPFDALLSEKAQTPADYRRLPYLMNTFTISRLYMSSLVVQQPKHFSLFAQQAKNFAGFAPEYQTFITEQSSLNSEDASSQNLRLTIGDLPGAKKEVENIHKLLDGEIWINQAATKKEFLEHASQFSLLHLAMHGIVNHTNPYYSHLLFNPSKQSHKLYASELYNLKLNADMVVLSACNSGTGNVFEGEGIMSLSHAFSYAGVSSLIMTLWSISDETTANLMEYFYSNLILNQTKDDALRNAKLEYLKQADPFYAHPFFWAAFVPIGDMSPVTLNRRFPIWVWVVLGVILASGTFGIISRRSN